MRTISVLLILFLAGFYCTAQSPADYVFYNAKIYTADADQSFQTAIAVTDNLISYIGNDEGSEGYIGDLTVVKNMNGKLLMPGLHDVHTHPLEASSAASASCILNSQTFNVENLALQLVDCNPQPNSNGWITAWGHSIYALIEYNGVPKDVLDQYFPNTPVAIMEETSHSFWVNSAALEELGIDETSEDPTGGHIVFDPFTNEPNGLLLDNAGDWANQAALSSTEEIDNQNYDGLAQFGLPLLARNGITSICEGRTYWKRGFHEIWQELYDNEELTVRTNLGMWMYPDDEDEEQQETLAGFYNPGNDFLRTSQVKVYIDGITINGTAALDQPYVYYFGWPFEQGLNYFSETRLADYITELEPLGYDFHIHAIGNRGVHEALNAIEIARDTNGDLGSRHRITHVEIVNEEDLTRFAELNVIADAQVAGFWTNPQFWPENAELIGDELAERFIPIKSLYDAGAHLTLSSDWDVSAISPFVGIQNAVTRAPENLPNVETAVDAYTIKAAYVMRHEENTGSLEVGKWADIICVDRDIFTVPSNQISQTQLDMTMLDGEIIYSSNNFSLGVNDQTRPNEFSISPSLANSFIKITAASLTAENLYIHIYNAAGKQVLSQTVSNNDSLAISHLAEGIYSALLMQNQVALGTKKFIISR